MLSVLFAGAFMSLPFAAIAGVILWSRHVTERRNRAWARVAQSLGLYCAPDSIWGRLDGHDVRLRTEMRGSGKSRHMVTVVVASFTPPLDLGLHVTRHGFFADMVGSLLGQVDVTIGDPTLDPLFTIRADEPARAARLLTLPLRHAMVAMARSGNDFLLSDDGFSMTRQGGVEHEQWLHWALRTAGQVARLVHESRAHVPAAWPLQAQQHEWLRFARHEGLAAMTTPLCIWGRLGGVDVSAYAVRAGQLLYNVEVLVRFEGPLGVGLLVRPAQALDGIAALFGGQDLVIGDAFFDAAFVVHASDPRRVREILDAEVRARAVELHQRIGRVQIRDDGITLRSLVPARDPSEVPRLVDALKTLADRIHANARGRNAAAGPYR